LTLLKDFEQLILKEAGTDEGDDQFERLQPTMPERLISAEHASARFGSIRLIHFCLGSADLGD
jgi:hypothetical protein